MATFDTDQDLQAKAEEYLKARAPRGQWKVEIIPGVDQLLVTEENTGHRHRVTLLIGRTGACCWRASFEEIVPTLREVIVQVEIEESRQRYQERRRQELE